MGWNGFGEQPAETTSTVTSNAPLHKKEFFIFGFLLLLLFAIVFFFIFSSGDSKTPKDDSPHKPTKALMSSQNSKTASLVTCTSAPISVSSDYTKPTNGVANIVLNAKKHRVIKWKQHEKILFNNHFENCMESFITASPGERFLEIDLGDDFDDSFQASLTNRIVITPSDTADEIAIKRAMIETKEAFRQQVSAGKTASELVLQLRKEFNQIADMRDELQEKLNSKLLSGLDPKEILLFAKEANALLAEYGALPLDAPDNVDEAFDALDSAKQAAIEELEAAGATGKSQSQRSSNEN